MLDNFEMPPIKDGKAEIQSKSWNEFSSFIDTKMKIYENYVWRGQRNQTWKLETTIDRLRKATFSAIRNFDDEDLERFKYAVRGRRGTNAPVLETENDWWALGQHHGLATPLLDWTTSPFVAAYFAFIAEDDESDNRVVYAMSQYLVEKKARLCKANAEREKRDQKLKIKSGEVSSNILSNYFLSISPSLPVEFIKPLSDENMRLVNQAGLFTRAPQNKPIDDWVGEEFHSENQYVLFKFLIPNSERKNCLTMLNRMNINHLTLFPDIYGASKYSNVKSTIDSY